jgi:PTH1 family peptidyl-tRNA hydrolase
MHLLIGLGNPGTSYAGNRHNAGFMLVDALAEEYRASAWSKKFNALVAEAEIAGQKILLIKPQTYMNRSGQSVGEAMRFYKLFPSDITVFHDDLDLPFGKLRVKLGGGHGGHNGLKDIDAHIGKDYRRVRLGIGHPGDKDLVTDYVLSDFNIAEKKQLKDWLEKLCTHLPLLLENKDAEFMTRMA